MTALDALALLLALIAVALTFNTLRLGVRFCRRLARFDDMFINAAAAFLMFTLTLVASL